MIVKPTQMNFETKKIAMIIAGLPGTGKTTLALSAPKPLLIDLDKGVDRVEVLYRKDTLFVDSYEELKKELRLADLSGYETIVIDTGGKLFELIKPYLIKDNPKNAKSDGDLSLQGYGKAKKEFSNFVKYIKGLGKHLIVIFHATETKLLDDLVGLRIRIEGSTKDEVWDDMDLGAFIEINNKTRTLSFNNCERYYAKGTHGIHGVYEIPTLTSGKKNEFLTKLFEEYYKELKQETEDLKKYQEAVESVDFKDVNKAYEKIKTMTHYLSSKEELWSRLKVEASKQGLIYDKASDKFLPSNAKSNK